MAKYAGEYSETFTVDVPIEKAEAHFSNLETIATNYGGVAEYKILKNNSLKLVLEPRTELGVTFEGWHTIRYTMTGNHVLKWKSVGKGNMTSKGVATFKSRGKKKTEIEYTDFIECDMEVNFLVAAIIGRAVSRQIKDGVRQYLKRMRKAL